MTVSLRLPKQLRNLYGVPDREPVEGRTVAELFEALDVRYAGIRHGLVDGRRLRRHIIVFVGTQQGDLDTPVPAGGEVTVVAAVAGGSSTP